MDDERLDTAQTKWHDTTLLDDAYKTEKGFAHGVSRKHHLPRRPKAETNQLLRGVNFASST